MNVQRNTLNAGIAVAWLLGLSVTLSWAQDVGQREHRTEPYLFRSNSGTTVKAQLGSFSVAENRQRADSPRISLKYIRFAANGGKPGNPIVYLAGGPGGSGSGTGRGSRFEMFMELRQLGDVILFDQRGTGMSHSLPNGASWAIPSGEAATPAVAQSVVLTALEESLEIWQKAGVDLKAYNTEENADDLAALREVLGARQLRLVGSSYGTHLALCCLRRHPTLVERAVLAGVEGPNHTLKLPVDQQDLLAKIQLWLDKDPERRTNDSDLVEKLGQVLNRLEKEPARIPWTSGERVLTAFDVRRFLAASLRGPDSIAMIPRLVNAMAEGNFSFVGMAHPRLRGGTFEAMPLAMDAASGATRERLELIRQQADATMLADAINFPLNVIIPRLVELDLGDNFRLPVVSDVPVLAISGTADGRTPAGNAVEVLKTLSHGQHLLIHGAGHGDPLFLASPKIMITLKRFLRGEDVRVTEIELPAVKFW